MPAIPVRTGRPRSKRTFARRGHFVFLTYKRAKSPSGRSPRQPRVHLCVPKTEDLRFRAIVLQAAQFRIAYVTDAKAR